MAAAPPEGPLGQNTNPNEAGECITVGLAPNSSEQNPPKTKLAERHQPRVDNTTRMAPATELRMSGHTQDSTSQEGIIRRAKAAVETLREGGPLKVTAKNDIAMLLEIMIQHIQSSTDSCIEVLPAKDKKNNNNCKDTRFDILERKIDELTAAITSGRSYAQVAATNTATPAPTIATIKRQQLQLGNKERAAVELALSASSASSEVQQQIVTDHPKSVTAKFQHAINMTNNLDNKPRILGINKQGKGNSVRLQFKTAAEAQQVKEAEIDWNLAFEGIQVHKPKYGIAVHGVATNSINLNDDYNDTAMVWENQNDMKIVKITTLRRQAKHQPTAHRSLIIFTENAEAANRCIKRGFFIDNLHHRAERYAPHLHINQCYKCHGFRHRSTTCKQKQRCGHCGQDDHLTKDCANTEHQCVNCKGEHESWHKDCPTRTEENRRLNTLRLESSPFFT